MGSLGDNDKIMGSLGDKNMGLWVTNGKMGGHWVRAASNRRVFLIAHGAQPNIECPAPMPPPPGFKSSFKTKGGVRGLFQIKL